MRDFDTVFREWLYDRICEHATPFTVTDLFLAAEQHDPEVADQVVSLALRWCAIVDAAMPDWIDA